MKKLVLLTLFLGTSTTSFGEVSTRVCRADGNTPLDLADSNVPFVYRNIMVGTRLTIYVDSNVAEEGFWGGLAMQDVNMANIGLIYGIECDEVECPGSCLPAAGDGAAVFISIMYPGPGFELYGGFEPVAGDWFVFDYNSIDLGDCNVAFYDYNEKLEEPIHTLRFHHVRTRDFKEDYIVNLADFAELSFFWQQTTCSDSNDCNETDLNVDGKVDEDDFMLFTDFWLEETR
jgi:hypothetical protein